jgi:phage gp45-like
LLSTHEPFRNIQSVATGERLTICATKTVTLKYFQVKVEAAGNVKVIAPLAHVLVITFPDKSVFTNVAVADCAQTAAVANVGVSDNTKIHDVLVPILV